MLTRLTPLRRPPRWRATPQRFHGGWTLNDGSVFGAYADEYDVHRPSYPTSLFALPAFVPPQPSAVAIDVAAGTGIAGIEIAKRGWRTTAVDHDEGMLQQASMSASKAGVPIAVLMTNAETLDGVPPASARLLTCFQAFHWLDAPVALEAFAATLAPGGHAVLAWNDRDLSHPWVCDLEAIVEAHNPKYNRDMKQTKVWSEDGAAFTQGGHFTVKDTYTAANPVTITGDGLVALMNTMSYVRNALSPEALESFNAAVSALATRHHGNSPFTLPWQTTAYVLAPATPQQ